MMKNLELPIAIAVIAAACAKSSDTLTDRQGLVAACVATATAAPSGAWVCPDARTAECTSHAGGNVDFIYVEPPATLACADVQLEAPSGPFPVGTQVVVVEDASSGTATEVCRAELEIVDTRPPSGRDRGMTLWPPNHKTHAIAPADCVEIEDDCDANVRVTFTSVASDEPADANGDGHTEPDIIAGDCERVELRAERSGGGNGRVYTLAWHAEDASGNASEGTCHVAVPHDQSGRAAIDDGVDHQVDVTHCAP